MEVDILPTIGDRADAIEDGGGINEEKAREILSGIESSPSGSINGQLASWLKDFVNAGHDPLALAVEEEMIGLDSYVAKRKVEILKQILPE